MDWTQAVDGYCERIDPSFWAEPVNAVTNAAFLLAALLMWQRRGVMPGVAVLCAILFAIGTGSFLFHTFAQPWAGLADVAPIVAFILAYVYLMNRTGWGLRAWPALGLTTLFFPYAAATGTLFGRIPGLGASAGYMPVLLLIALYAAMLRRRAPALARGLGIGAALLALSLTFRTLDLPLCGSLPLGTHFLWHLLNAVMLGWMIEVYARAALGKGQGAG
ncbi:MAG: ceramidase domain-containing protein [Pseudomonadota bacterium]